MKMTQARKVFDILEKKTEIDNYFCLSSMLTIRLGAIIYILKDRGLIEIDYDRTGFIEGTKNYRYVVKRTRRIDSKL